MLLALTVCAGSIGGGKGSRMICAEAEAANVSGLSVDAVAGGESRCSLTSLVRSSMTCRGERNPPIAPPPIAGDVMGERPSNDVVLEKDDVGV